LSKGEVFLGVGGVILRLRGYFLGVTRRKTDPAEVFPYPRKLSLDTRQILWYNGRRRGLDLSFRTTTTSARMRTEKISYHNYFGALAQHKRE